MMRPDLTTVVSRMARREALAALLTPPLVETGAAGPRVRVDLVACPTCGAPADDRPWTPPFGDGPLPVLSMLACERVTARAVLPIVVAAERFPELRTARFQTRGLTWLEVSHLHLDKALEAIDAAERWVTDPADTDGRTLPASTRRHAAAMDFTSMDFTSMAWPSYRRDLVPSFLSPHASVPSEVEGHYAAELRTAILANRPRQD
jgi:hypothetical protein